METRVDGLTVVLEKDHNAKTGARRSKYERCMNAKVKSAFLGMKHQI